MSNKFTDKRSDKTAPTNQAYKELVADIVKWIRLVDNDWDEYVKCGLNKSDDNFASLANYIEQRWSQPSNQTDAWSKRWKQLSKSLRKRLWKAEDECAGWEGNCMHWQTQCNIARNDKKAAIDLLNPLEWSLQMTLYSEDECPWCHRTKSFGIHTNNCAAALVCGWNRDPVIATSTCGCQGKNQCSYHEGYNDACDEVVIKIIQQLRQYYAAHKDFGFERASNYIEQLYIKWKI